MHLELTAQKREN